MRKNSGFSVLEVVLGMVLMGMASSFFLRSQSVFTKSLTMNRTIASRDSIYFNLERQVKDVKLLAKSLSASTLNSAFHICIAGGSSTQKCVAKHCEDSSGNTIACTATSSKVDNLYSFNLLNPTTEIIAGEATAPIYYGENGNICDPLTDTTCRFKATALFKPVCLNNEDTCSKAEYIQVGISYEPNQEAAVQAGAGFQPGGRSTASFISVHATDVSAAVSKVRTCSDKNQFMSGMDESGNPVCGTFPSCSGNQIFQGINPDGTAKCGAAQAFAACPAKHIQVGNHSNGAPNCYPLQVYHRCIYYGYNPRAYQDHFMSTDPGCEGRGSVAEAPNYFFAISGPNPVWPAFR